MEMLTKYLIGKFKLSLREAEVVYFVCKGWTNKEVATALCVCEKTIKFHLTNIYKKASVKTRSRLITLCVAEVPHSFNSKPEVQTEVAI